MKLLLVAASLSVWSGVYTPEEAARGKAVYTANCAAACHIANLSGNGTVPALAGPDFILRWEDFTVGELLTKIRATMPKVAPGSLSEAQYVDAAAYILSANGFPAGTTALSANLKAVIAP